MTHIYFNLKLALKFMAITFLATPTFADEDTTWSTRQSVALGSQTYNVAVSPDKTYALVGPTSRSTKMTVKTVERAAKTASGCRASVERVISMWTGGKDDAAIPMSSIKGRKTVRATLKC
jgi:hypothetical protein